MRSAEELGGGGEAAAVHARLSADAALCLRVVSARYTSPKAGLAQNLKRSGGTDIYKHGKQGKVTERN